MHSILKAAPIALTILWTGPVSGQTVSEPAVAETAMGQELATAVHEQLFEHLIQTWIAGPVTEVIADYPAQIPDFPTETSAHWRSAVQDAVDDAEFHEAFLAATVQELSDTEARVILDHFQSAAGYAVRAAERARDLNPDASALVTAAASDLAQLSDAEREPFERLALAQFSDAAWELQAAILRVMLEPVLGHASTAEYLASITPILRENARDFMLVEAYLTYRDLAAEDLTNHTVFVESPAGQAYVRAVWEGYRQVYGEAAVQISAAYVAAQPG